GRRDGDAPWRFEVVARDQALQQVAARVEDVHEAGAVVALVRRRLVVDLGVGGVQLAAQVLDVEWRVAVRHVRVAEGAGQRCRLVLRVENGDAVVAEIGGVQVVGGADLADRQPGERRAGHGRGYVRHHRGRRKARVPAGNLARLRGEDEPGRGRRAAGTHLE